MSKRAMWDKSDRECVVCGEVYSPVREVQKFCPPPKRCRNTTLARLIMKQTASYEQRDCVNCGESYKPVLGNQVTCGMNCSGKPEVIKSCVLAFCGKQFSVDMNTTYGHHQKYCSRECSRLEESYAKHNITSVQYVELLENQGGVCAACGKPPEGGRLYIDHDHTCCPNTTSCGKCIRALLHRKCNLIEGMVKEDPSILLKIYEYLKKEEINTDTTLE